MRLPYQLHREHTALHPFRRIELIVHIAISVIPGTDFHLIKWSISERSGLPKDITSKQWPKIGTEYDISLKILHQGFENARQAATSTKLCVPTITPRPSLNYMCVDIGTASKKMGQHWTNIGSVSCVCWVPCAYMYVVEIVGGNLQIYVIRACKQMHNNNRVEIMWFIISVSVTMVAHGNYAHLNWSDWCTDNLNFYMVVHFCIILYGKKEPRYVLTLFCFCQ